MTGNREVIGSISVSQLLSIKVSLSKSFLLPVVDSAPSVAECVVENRFRFKITSANCNILTDLDMSVDSGPAGQLVMDRIYVHIT